MTDKKISALTQHSAPLQSDVFAIVDLVASQTKKVPLNILATAVGEDYTAAGVLVWPKNTAVTIAYSSPGVISSISTIYKGLTYTMTFTGDPVTTITVTDGTTVWTKTITYTAGDVSGISAWV